MFDQLSEPAVINMAAEVAGLNTGMPKARNDKERGEYDDGEKILAKKA
jgi:hypothetical protein